MKTIETWFSEYGESHQNKTNKIIHKICVPLISWTIAGLLWTIPVPEFFYQYNFNWAHLALIFAFVFYLSLKNVKAFLMAALLFIPAIIFFHYAWPLYGYQVGKYSLFVFILAWIGQFIGHKIEGKKPSFFKDLQFLLIGPIWIFNDLIKITK